jgi:PhnB protein
MQINTYLTFSGNCAEAFQFYARLLGGKVEDSLTFAGTEAEGYVPADWRSKVMHSQMRIGDNVLMGSDAPPAMAQKPQGFSVSIQISDVAEGERIFNAFAEGGQVTMPFAKTFWAERFGMVTDRFGIPWMVNVAPAQA